MSSRWQTVWVTDSSGDRPGLAGHLDKVVRLRLAGPDVVVSADDSGTIVARRSDDGSLVARPTRTGIPGIVALAAWVEGVKVRAATGAGSGRSPYPWLQRWDLETGDEKEPPSKLDVPQVRHVEKAVVRGEPVLVVVHRGLLQLRRTADGTVFDEVRKHRGTFRLVTGVSEQRPIAVVSALDLHPEIFHLDDLAAPPSPVPGLDGGYVVAVEGNHLVSGSLAERRDAWRTAWGRDLSGHRVGPGVTGTPITSVAIAGWPAVYIARIDGTVSLVDLESGEELCPALRLPTAAGGIAVVGVRGLIVAFGSDVARLEPPG